MYSIHVLPQKQFNKLPYKDVDISLGLADRQKGRIYVRESGIPAIDLLTIGHEIHEMVSKVSPHEEDGIRYKKGGVLRSIVPIIVGAVATVLTGGVAAPLLLGGLTGAGMGAYAGSRHKELGGAGRAGLMGGISGALGGLGAGSMLSGGMAGGASAAPGFLSKAGGITQGALFGTGTAAAPAGIGTAARIPVSYPGTGLFGAGNLLGGIGSSKLGNAATQMMAQSALTGMMNPSPSMSEYPSSMDYNMASAQYAGTPGEALAPQRQSTPSTSSYLPGLQLPILELLGNRPGYAGGFGFSGSPWYRRFQSQGG